ncbi:MAG TPA: putative glycolipid-binding domain-containing protein [Ilumatobacter sp.]|nr:putative glycolipid-binding domain-containing protein [Ilumatobacter sp.]
MPEPSHYPPFPADGYAARWSTWDGAHGELFTLAWENEAWTATGRVGGADIEYVIRLSPLWQARQVLLFRDLDEPDLWLGTDGHGRWGEVNGAHRPELDGAVDVAFGVTPALHVVPIRRLGLAVGHSVTLPVLTIDVDTLAVATVTHTYTRRAEHDWTVAVADATEVGFTVDPHGLPLDVPGTFRRIEQ